ncbi:MAG: sulfatase-like hydrolase/transferase [Planctomycetota bacterium]|nr:sulfatase-like hydrolase/transferase [Planctomycetota bacterium]
MQRSRSAGGLCRVPRFLGFLAFFLAGLSAVKAAEERPNVIFIFTDDHASHAISAYGSKINKTPNIDRLAAEGMRFDNVFCTNSICGPSRAVILTGKHSHLNGFRTNGNRFDGSQQTFPKLLRRAGYQTAMIGKWHLKSEPTGFDFWKVLIGQGPYYNPPMKTPGGVEKHIGYTTEIITDMALEWLEEGRDREKPFLLMYQHKAPHREWAPGPKYLHLYDDVTIPEPATLFDDWANRTSATKTQTMTIAEHLNQRDLKLVAPRNLTPEQLKAWNAAYGPKNAAFEAANLQGKDLVRWKYQRYIKDYLRCIAAVDDNIGRLLEYLDDKGLARNTVVIYSSDQGFYLGDHGWFDKRWMYEESLRMPFIVRWPAVIKPGSVNRHLVQNLDFAETFLDLAGAEIPGDMQGRSLVPLFKGESPADWRQSIYYHYYEFPGAHSVRRHLGVRTERHKLIHYYTIKEWELFDLEKDFDELRSVHADPAYASVRHELEAELKRLQEHYGDTNPEAGAAARGQRRPRRAARRVKLRQVLALPKADGKRRGDLDPAVKPITVGARCTPETGDGVIVAHGGASLGYSLYLKGGKPRFAVRNEGVLRHVEGEEKLELGRPVHVAGVLDPRGRLRLYVNGRQVASGEGHLISHKPEDGLSVGSDSGSPVGDYEAPLEFQGELTDIRIYWGVLDAKALKEWAGAGR